jgi:chromosome partitioning protein
MVEESTPLANALADKLRRRDRLEQVETPRPKRTRTITISNQKGGVGKTTTAVNLAAALVRRGARVLVIDLDPQGNASTALGADHRPEVSSIYDVLLGDDELIEVMQKSTDHQNLWCVPSTIHLAGSEIELVQQNRREYRLADGINALVERLPEPFDYILIDCPPSLGLLTVNAFVAAQEVLIPIQCEYYALEGLSQLIGNIELVQQHLNPALHLSTILLTMYDSRTKLSSEVADEVREHFPRETLESTIPRSVRISEAPSYGQSVLDYDPKNIGSIAYLEAAHELASRHDQTSSITPVGKDS